MQISILSTLDNIFHRKLINILAVKGSSQGCPNIGSVWIFQVNKVDDCISLWEAHEQEVCESFSTVAENNFIDIV